MLLLLLFGFYIGLLYYNTDLFDKKKK